MSLNDYGQVTQGIAAKAPARINMVSFKPTSLFDYLTTVPYNGVNVLTPDQARQIEAFSTSSGPIITLANKEGLFELYGLLNRITVEQVIEFLSQCAANDIADFIWYMPTMHEAMKHFEFEVKVKMTKPKGMRGLTRCGKCGGDNITFAIAQTSGGDEGMTTFYACLGCGNRWKTRG